jgi:hypothetical protein
MYAKVGGVLLLLDMFSDSATEMPSFLDSFCASVCEVSLPGPGSSVVVAGIGSCFFFFFWKDRARGV